MRSPWDVDRAIGPTSRPDEARTERSEETDEQQPADQSEGENRVERASYWASRAVGASREYASAQVWNAVRRNRAVAESETEDDSGNSPSSSEKASFDKLERDSSANDASGSEDARKTAENSEPADSGSTLARTGDEGDAPSASQDSLDWPVTMRDSSRRGANAVVDPTAKTDVLSLSDEDVRSRLKEEYGLDELPDSKHAVAVEGTFSNVLGDMERLDLPAESLSQQLAVIEPGHSVSFYAGPHRVAKAEFGNTESLPSELRDVRPVRAVDDGTLQLLFYWGEKKSDSEAVEYRVGLLKLVGARVGRTIQRTVAIRPKKGGELQRKGYLTFLRGRDHRRVQWTPADDSGSPKTADASVLHWNEWEGVFRPPGPPPTAPDQRS